MIYTARCKVPAGSSNWLDAPKAGWLLAHTPQQESKGDGNEQPSKSDIYVWWTACCKSRSMSAEGKAWVSGVCKAISVTAKLQRTEKGCDRTKTLKGQRNFNGYFVLGGCGVGDGVLEYYPLIVCWNPPSQSIELSWAKAPHKNYIAIPL